MAGNRLATKPKNSSKKKAVGKTQQKQNKSSVDGKQSKDQKSVKSGPKNAKNKSSSNKSGKKIGAENRPSIKRKIFKWTAIVFGILILAPIAVTFLYAIPTVKPVSTLMAYHWVSGKDVKREWVAFDDISPSLIQSVLMSEDGRYCSHSGVDWDAVNLVIDDAIEGEPVRGASTIPMQSVKNLYLWSSRSYLRKAMEIPLALLVDSIWGKRRLLEIYLNVAEWGPGIYGIQAASRHHFRRSAAKLNRRQAALLAVTLPNPIVRNPRKPNRGLRRLARVIERRARASGAYIGCLK